MSVTDFIVEEIIRKPAAEFVEKHHYSHSTNGVQSIIHYGLFEPDKDNSRFGVPKMIGAAMYAWPSMPDTGKKYNPINPRKCLELRRFVCIDDTPKNTESYFLGQTFNSLGSTNNVQLDRWYFLVGYVHPFDSNNFSDHQILASVMLHRYKNALPYQFLVFYSYWHRNSDKL